MQPQVAQVPLGKEASGALNSGVSYEQGGYWERLQESWRREATELQLQCAALTYLRSWEKIYAEFLVCTMDMLRVPILWYHEHCIPCREQGISCYNYQSEVAPTQGIT